MHKTGVRLAYTALLLIFAAPGSTQVSSRDRIFRPVDAAQTAVVRGTAHPLAGAQFDQGRTDPSQALHGVSLTFRLSPVQQADLDSLLRQQQDPSSLNYRKWLTPEQYAARFGMTQNDLAKVTAWLQSQGLTVDGISRNRTEVSFSGSVGQIEYALRTEIHNYSINGERHFANATDVALPAAFSGEVLGVRNLNDFRPKPRIRRASSRFTSSVTGIHNLIPADFAKIYTLPSQDGAGQTIAVVGQTDISNTDIDAFRSAAGLAKNDPTVVPVPGTGSLAHFSGDESEADLDLEWSGGVAPSATIKYVTVGNNQNFSVFDSLNYAVQHMVAPVISISYGNCEAKLGRAFVLTMQQWAQQANVQGQTISGPSGDDGAADCDSKVASATHGLAVDAPASIPEVTGVGGTEFTGDPAAVVPSGSSCAPATTFWGSSCDPTPGVGNPTGASALGYIPETTWNDAVTSQGFSSSGGGASIIFGKPSWQVGSGVPNDGERDVPDVALSASPGHDGYLICSQDFFTSGGSTATSCTSGFRASDQTLARIGGTSAGAPIFAGILALINQATASNGLGNVNPMLYSLAANPSSSNAFNPVTSGDNKVPCTAGTRNCPSGGKIGFIAGPGYDQVTGLGSLNVSNLITAWLAATPSADFSIAGLVSSVSAPGQQGTSTITVSALNGFTGTVNLSCAPSVATTRISCSLSAPSVDLTSSTKTATITMNIATLADLRLHPHRPWFEASGATLFAAVILGGVPLRRRNSSAILGLLVFVCLSLALGCGGGSSSTQPSQGAPAVTYMINVTGASGTISHTTAVSVTVQ